MKVLLNAIAFLSSIALLGVSPDELHSRAKHIATKAEAFRHKDPDFADFVREQSAIYRSYEKAYRYELKKNPAGASAVLYEWNSLVERMEAEVLIFKDQVIPENKGMLNVRDFGAKGDGISDDAPAVRKAIATAIAQKKGGVYFPAGTYFLSHMSQKYPAPVFEIKKVKDFKLKGENGTILLMDHPRPPYFRVVECENLHLENFHVTSKKPFYSTGIVTGFTEDNKGFYFRREDGLEPDDPMFRECDFGKRTNSGGGFIRLMSAQTTADGRTPLCYMSCAHEYAHNFWGAVFKKAPGKNMYIGYPLFKGKPFSNAHGVKKTARDMVCIGRRVTHQVRDYIGAFSYLNSPRCRFKRISMDSTAGINFYIKFSDLMFVTDCNIAAPVDSKTAFSSAADFFFLTGASAGGYIARNVVKNLGDDYLNLHGILFPVIRKEGKVIYINRGSGTYPLPKEYVKYLRSVDLFPAGNGKEKQLISNKTRYKVVSAEAVTLQHPAEYLDMEAVKKGFIKSIPLPPGGPETVEAIKLELDRDPGNIAVTDPYISFHEAMMKRGFAKDKSFTLVNMTDLYSQGQVIVNNYFADGISRVWITGSGSLIKGNTFHHPAFGWLWYNDWNHYVSWWSEAFYPRIVTIEGNVFSVADSTMFTMGGVRYDKKDPSSRLKHYYIRNNQIMFDNIPCFIDKLPLFNIKGVSDLEISGNTFTTWSRSPRTRFIIEDADVVIEKNNYHGNFAPDKIGSNVTILGDHK